MLIDTSGWFCLLDRMDLRHETAAALYRSTSQRITTNYIIAELVALGNARKQHRAALLSFVSAVLNDSDVHIIWVDESLNRAAFDLLKQRPDKNWSLCDAVSFVIMKQVKVTDVLTTDHHFEQAGFVKLLES